MSMLEARIVTEKYLPGLVAELQARGRMELERAEPAVLCELFRRFRGAGLIIPETYGGLGASTRETVEILRVVASLCPSLAVMMTMHHHTIATIVQLGGLIPAADDLLCAIAQNQLLIASAFAEGKSGAEIFNASVKARPVEGGFLLSGTKKPCTMSQNMDVIVVGVVRENADGSFTQGFAVVFDDGSQIVRKPFWNTSILRAADSNSLSFDEVFVPAERMLLAEGGDEQVAASVQDTSLSGLCWFQLMVGGTYLGVVCALVGLLLSRRVTEDGPLALLAIELEGAQQALMGAARELEQQRAADATVYAKALCTRFMVQGAIERSSNLAVEALGGISFIASDEVAYLLAASRAICFHPISRAAATPLLASYLRESA